MASEEYKRLQKEAGFKSGDRVVIARAPRANELGWGIGTPKDSQTSGKLVGKLGEINMTDSSYGFAVKIDGFGPSEEYWWWPYFAIKKVDPATGLPENGDPAKVIESGKNVAIVIDNKVTLIGSFTKTELEGVIAQLTY